MSFQAPEGVAEYLPPRGAPFEQVRDAFAESARRACHAPVETAVFEDTAPFVRGGPPLPGIGFAAGHDRIVLAVESERAGQVRPAAAAGQVFGVPLGEEARADVLALITSLRRAGIRADMVFGARGLKGAMKAADRSGADYALLIGTDGRRDGTVRMKDLRSGDQQDVAATAATDWLIGALATEGLRDER